MPDLYEQHRLLVRSEPLLLVEGTLEHRDRQLNIRATHLSPLATPDRSTLPQQPPAHATLRSVVPAPQHFAQGRRRA